MFVLGIILIGSFYLATPLIIRYIVIKKPLSKKDAMIITAGNFGITFLIPLALIGVPDISYWNFVMVLVSYTILENKRKDTETSTKDTDTVYN